MKRKKPLVRTDYAVRTKERPLLWLCDYGNTSPHFQRARMYTTRGEAAGVKAGVSTPSAWAVIPVRCRPLSVKSKRSKHRTK